MDTRGFATTYGVELLCATAPSLEKRALAAALRRYCPGAEPLDGDLDSSLLAFVHSDHLVRLEDGAVPAQTLIAASDEPFESTRIEGSLQQSWSFPEARAVVAGCTASVIVTDLMSSPLDPRERLDLFQRVLRGALEQIDCEAIHWRPTQVVVSTKAYRQAALEAPAQLFFCGGVNVRLFNVEGSGDRVMDTLGLAALGLPDLQCHFRALDVKDVARVLYDTAWYVFQSGDVIEDGNTVEGVQPGSKWHCQHEEALVEPHRDVLDIDPGRRFAAGS